MSDPKKMAERMTEAVAKEEERLYCIAVINAQIEIYREQLNRTIGAIAALQEIKNKLENEQEKKEEKEDGKGH